MDKLTRVYYYFNITMEGERNHEQEAFMATVLAVFEQADSNLTDSEKGFISHIARQVFSASREKGESLRTAVERRLKTYERVAEALLQARKDDVEIPSAFQGIELNRLLYLVGVLSANIAIFEQTKAAPS